MPPLGHNVCREVCVHAPMEFTIRQAACVPARLPDLVHYRCPRHVARLPAGISQSSAQISIFPVQKIAVRQSPSPPTSASRRASMQAPDTQSTRRLGIALSDARGRGKISAHDSPIRKPAREQRRTAEQPCEHVRVAPGAFLQRAVRVEDFRADHRTRGMPLEFVEQGAYHSRV